MTDEDDIIPISEPITHLSVSVFFSILPEIITPSHMNHTDCLHDPLHWIVTISYMLFLFFAFSGSRLLKEYNIQEEERKLKNKYNFFKMPNVEKEKVINE